MRGMVMVETPRRPISSPALVGRDRESELLTQAWHAARQGRGRCVLITGDAGVGKSRLLSEVRAHLTPLPSAVVAGVCFEEDAAFPYALLIDALRTLFAHWTDTQIGAALGGGW
jgi:predicted ATPase